MPATSSYTVSAAFFENLVWAAAEEGLDVAHWQRQLGGPQRGDDRLALADFSALWQSLLEQTGDPLIGLRLGTRFRLGRYGLVEFFLLNARTVRDALSLSADYWRLVIDEGKQLRLVETEHGWRLLIETRIVHPPPAFDMDMVYGVRWLSLVLGRPVEGLGISLGLAHAMPAGATADDYRRHFGCEVAFGQACYWMEVPKALAEQPLAGHPVIVEAVAAQAQLQLRLLDRPQALAGRVSHLIELGAVDVQRVADQLHLGVRSLQRRLKEEGTSFAELRDSGLRRRAERLLAEPRMALKEVAYLLGYEERGLFEACQRWFGLSPSLFRARSAATAQGSELPASEADPVDRRPMPAGAGGSL